MAETGTVTKQAFYDINNIVILKTTLTELSTDTTTNVTRVNVKVELIGNSNTQNAWSNFRQDLTVKVGSSIRNLDFNGYNLAYGASKTIYNTNWSINRDPNASGVLEVVITLTDEAATKGTSWPVAKTSYSIQLQMSEINAASIPTINVQSAFIGDSVIIQTNRKSTDNVHNIDYIKPNGEAVRISTGATTNFTWRIPNDIANFMPDSLNYSLPIRVTTFNGSTQIQNPQTTNLTVQINQENPLFVPTVYTPTYSDNAAFYSNIKMHLKNRSKFNFSATATGKYGATIRVATLIYRKKSTSSSTRVPANVYDPIIESSEFSINNTGDYEIFFEVVDSRGITVNSPIVTINILDYNAPILSNTSANRKEGEQTTVVVSAIGTGASLSGKNTLTLTIKMRLSGQNIDWETINDIDKITNTTGKITLNRNLTNTNEAVGYDIQFTLTDTVGSVSKSVLQISSSAVLWDAYKDEGISIGQLYDETLGGRFQLHKEGFYLGQSLIKKDGYAKTTLSLEDNDIKYNGTSLLGGSSSTSSDTMVVVNHGNNGNASRPENALAVYWIGSVEPKNATIHDIWVK